MLTVALLTCQRQCDGEVEGDDNGGRHARVRGMSPVILINGKLKPGVSI